MATTNKSLRELRMAIIETIEACDDDRKSDLRGFWPRFDDAGYLVGWMDGRYADNMQGVTDAVHELAAAGMITEAEGSAGSWKLTSRARTALKKARAA